MKKNLLLIAIFGSLPLWPGVVHAAAPRFDSWGGWQNQDVAKGAKKAEQTVASNANPQADKPTPKTAKTKTEKPIPAAKVVAATASEPKVITLGPPTKGRRPTASSEDDRLTPTPAPKIIVTKGEKAAAKVAVPEEEKLSLWERWRRKRQGIPLKPVIIPDSHVYTVRLREGKWTVKATRLECKLYQRVPHLGKVMFQRKVGTGLEFKMELNRSYESIHQAGFEAIPTPWGHQTHQRPLALSASVHKASLTVPREGAMLLIDELMAGMAPRMTYRMGDAETSDEVVVTLSARTFVHKVQAFQACINNLLPYKFEAVKESIVYFNFASARLTIKAKRALGRVAEYVRLDKKVKRIVIKGYTDSKGFRRYNYRLATRRANAVKKFFLDQGVSRTRLVLRLRAFGETKPVATNRSAKGRAKNRRVHINLFK